MNLDERIAVVEARLHNLQSRLLAVRTPQATLAHATALRYRAEQLLQAAERIERALQDDLDNQTRIKAELALVQTELEFYDTCRRNGVSPSRATVLELFRSLLSQLGE